MTISEIIHFDIDGKELWRMEDIHNVFHVQGEEYFLKALFTGLAIPTNYYVGLDNRLNINKADIASGLLGEPTGGGYTRKTVSSFGAVYESGKWRVKSTTLIFNAIGGGWGPVRNAFLTTSTGNSGYLISSVPLQSPRTLTDGQSLSFRYVLAMGE
jgi:hypothetical protein